MYHLILNVLVFFLPLLHGDKSTASNPDIKEGNEATQSHSIRKGAD